MGCLKESREFPIYKKRTGSTNHQIKGRSKIGDLGKMVMARKSAHTVHVVVILIIYLITAILKTIIVKYVIENGIK